MLCFRHKTLILISGLIWLGVGIVLLPLGLRFIAASAAENASLHSDRVPLLEFFSDWAGGSEQAGLFLITAGLALGYAKGRFILSRSVNRLVKRIRSFPEPAPISKIYSPPYYLLLCTMLFVGLGIKYLGIPYDIRGLIDVAIGAALLNGAMLYFRKLF